MVFRWNATLTRGGYTKEFVLAENKNLQARVALEHIQLTVSRAELDRKIEKLAQQYGGKDNIPSEVMFETIVGGEENVGNLARLILIVKALRETCERFGLSESCATVQKSLGYLVRKKFMSNEAIEFIDALFATTAPRRVIFNELQRTGDLTQEAINERYPTKASGEELQAWLDEPVLKGPDISEKSN